MSLNFQTILKNVKTGDRYACELQKDSFDFLTEKTIVTVYARSCKLDKYGNMVQKRRRRANSYSYINYFTPLRFQKSFLEFVESYK